MSHTNTYWVYMLLCDNNTYYTGYTHDLVKRFQSHLDGSGRCKYTRSFKPLKIVQCWKIKGVKADAMWLERLIKKMSRSKKEDIIAAPLVLCELLASLERASKVLVEPGSNLIV